MTEKFKRRLGTIDKVFMDDNFLHIYTSKGTFMVSSEMVAENASQREDMKHAEYSPILPAKSRWANFCSIFKKNK